MSEPTLHNRNNQESTPKPPSPDQDDFVLSLDAFVRSFGVRHKTPHTLFLGAGASVTSGIPSAENCIWEWKRSLFLTNNPGLEDQFSELSLPSARHRIQDWLNRQGTFPQEGALEEYGFYIRQCFPIAEDRRKYFQEKVRTAQPYIGYRLLCHLAQADLLRSVWSTNFDGLPARAAAYFSLSPLEIGIDTQGRLPRQAEKGELLCISMHGDYRYDNLKNTPEELQKQEKILRNALVEEIKQRPIIVCGYSGRDYSIMDALYSALSQNNSNTLYWCGYGDGEIPKVVADLIRHARAHGRQAYYVPAQGFDDLMTRLALHCLDGESRELVRKDITALASTDLLARQPFQVQCYKANTLIKSNAFEVDCPGEVLSFDLKAWPEEKVWAWLREQTRDRAVVAVPFRGKVLALGTIDDIKDIFGEIIKGSIERTPVSPDDLRRENGVIVRLMREGLVRSMAEAAGVGTDGYSTLWFNQSYKKSREGDLMCYAHESVLVFLRRIGGTQYVLLKPSIKVLDADGEDIPYEIAGPMKLRILGYQHNKEFNIAVNKWRGLLFSKNSISVFEFPLGIGSRFKFSVRRSPVFVQIGLPHGGKSVPVSDKLRPLVKYQGIELAEPQLVFCNKAATDTTMDTHPIRGVVTNRPFDYPLTLKGLASSLRVGVVCPSSETNVLRTYLQKANQSHRPSDSERDYLIDYPGFQQAYGLPIEIPEPGMPGWVECAEPAGVDQRSRSVSAAQQITNAIEGLRSSYAPHVVLIFFSRRWTQLRGYRDDSERFDVHDFVKAYAVQRGIATQFLEQDTSADRQQCRVWWWLSLALYVKGMRTPWVLKGLDEDTAYIGLGFSIDQSADKGAHVVLGCSHIYSARGEGLQYRLTKIENPIIRRGNPFMSKDDAGRIGETIRQLFF